MVVASCRLPFVGPKVVMPHQDVAGCHSRPMGSQPKKVDSWVIPKLGQRPNHFMNTPSRLFFLSKAMRQSSRSIISFMYKDKVY